jgi:low temperature requirement protein LtrA
MTDHPKQTKPLLDRILSLEGAMAAFGLYSLGSGLLQGELMSVFWGIMILVGLVILVAVRRRDWKQHWAALEQQHAASRPAEREPPEA